MTERPIDSITIGKRHRNDVGDIASLAASIRDVGLLHPPVITPDGTLIAGERRIRACESLGWTRVDVRVVDLDNVTRGELAENVEREPFLPSELDAIRRTLEPEARAAAEQRMKAGKPSEKFSKGRAADKVAAFAGVSRPTLDKIAAVVAAAEAEPERFGKLAEDMDRTGRVDGVYRRLSNMQQADRIRAEPPPLPTGPFRVIVADPPWPYDKRVEDPSHRGVHPYPTMSIADICALPVASRAHDNSILFLWTTNHHMRESFAVLDAWGFESITILTWAKDRFGFGDWLRGQTEHCHFATRGSPVVTLKNQSTLLCAPVTRHSAKPDAFYALVESLCPAPRYLELFARKTRPGWVGWGDEVPPQVPASSGTPDIELRYVPHESVEQFAADGWTATAGLEGTHHGHYAVLMQRTAPQ